MAWVVDISERLDLESAFRGLFETSPYGLRIVDDNGNRGGHSALMSSYRSTGESRMMGQGRDLTALHADGTELPVEIGLRRVRWQRQMMTLAVVSDISVRKRLEFELRPANDKLQEFSYVASRDPDRLASLSRWTLRSPLFWRRTRLWRRHCETC